MRASSTFALLTCLLALAAPAEARKPSTKLEIRVKADPELRRWVRAFAAKKRLVRCGRAGERARMELAVYDGEVSRISLQAKRRSLGHCIGKRLRRLRAPRGYRGTVRARLRWR